MLEGPTFLQNIGLLIDFSARKDANSLGSGFGTVSIVSLPPNALISA